MKIQDIMTAFIVQLKKHFDYKVYDEEIPQKFKTPSFFIYLVKLDFKRLTGLNRIYELSVAVTYFPSDKTAKQEEYLHVLQKITEEFDYLHVKDKMLHLNIIEQKDNERDDALVFLFKLEIYTRKVIDEQNKFNEEIEVHIIG